ncbi:MAG: hypothetical protein R3B06_13665 [Kofleriaceae bacterium]
MQKLVLATMVLGGLSQGCGSVGTSPGVDGGLDSAIDSAVDPAGDIQVTWALHSSDANGQVIAATCPAGGTSLSILAQPAAGGTPYVDKYLCADGAGTATALPPDDYVVWIQITDTAGAVKYAESAAYPVTVADGRTTPLTIDLFTDRAFFQAAWAISQAGSPTTCAAIGATNMSILATVASGTDAFDDDRSTCAAGESGTPVLTNTPVPTGAAYTVVLAPLNSQGAALGGSPARVNQTLTYGNQYLDLGNVPIAAD